MQDVVKWNPWMLIAEQNVLYVHYPRNQMELQHKCGAENVDMTSRATSYLKTIQPLHLLHAEACVLHAGSWSCRSQVFEVSEVAVRYPEFTAQKGSYYYSSGRRTCLWNKTLWPCLLRQLSVQASIDLLCPGAVPDCVSPALFRKNCHTWRDFNLLPLCKFHFCKFACKKKLTLFQLVQFATEASQQCWGMRWEESTWEQLEFTSGNSSWKIPSQRAITVTRNLEFSVVCRCIFSNFSAVLRI